MRSSVAAGFIHPMDERWAGALAVARHDVYDTPAYLVADAGGQGAEPSGFFAADGDRIFLLPLLLRTVPGCTAGGDADRDAISPYGYPGLVLSDAARETPGFVACCLRTFGAQARERRIRSAFIRLHPLLNDDIEAQLGDEVATTNGTTVSIDISLSDREAWASMRKGHTNAINKGIRAAYTVEIAPALDLLDSFADVYADVLGRLGSFANDAFDPERLRVFSSLEHAYVAVAWLDGVAAGAYLFYCHDGIVQMHLGGVRTAYMRPSPSHLLIWSVSRWAGSRGDRVMHLGGGVGGSGSDSLFTFKSGFASRRHRYQTLRLVPDPERYALLVEARARVLDQSPAQLTNSGFFPAYRSGMPVPGPLGVAQIVAGDS